MGILEVLTIVFVVLKLLSVIDWSWWLVLSPILFSISLYLIAASIGFLKTWK